MRTRTLLSEPALHFLLIGLLLFLFYESVAPVSTDSRTIEVSTARIDDLSRQFLSTWSRPPTDSERRDLIDSYVRDEVLYREGVAMGLDGDDPIIKRRIRQKMEVLSEESGEQLTPTDADLSDYLAKNPDKFRQLPIISFEQIYFPPDTSIADIERESKEALEGLNRGEAASQYGQATMLPARVTQRALDLIARDFGDAFAARLAMLPLEVWHGPIASNYGTHLLRISEREESVVPALADIRTAVTREWENERRERNRAESYRVMAKDYQIVIDDKAIESAKP